MERRREGGEAKGGWRGEGRVERRREGGEAKGGWRGEGRVFGVRILVKLLSELLHSSGLHRFFVNPKIVGKDILSFLFLKTN